MKITKSQLNNIIKEELKTVLNEEKSISDKELEELKTIVGELHKASDMHKSQAERIEGIIKDLVEEEIEATLSEKSNFFANMRAKQKRCKGKPKTGDCAENRPTKKAWKKITAEVTRDTYGSEVVDRNKATFKKSLAEEEFYEVDAKDINEEYCPVCQEAQLEEKKRKKKKKPCKKAKGKKFVKRVNGRCRSYGQAGKAKDGGPRIRPGTAKGDRYCARSAGIKKCKNPPCANTLSRKKWRCRGKKSMKA
jgi:hypothetical protein